VSETLQSEKGEVEKKGWLSRLRAGLSKSTKRVTESITGLFTKKKLDQQTLDELEDALIQADLGVSVAARLVEKLGKERFGKEVTDEEVRAAFADDIAEILQPVATSLAIDPARKPHVVLVVGVNGSGKTTSIAKLANLFRSQGKKVVLGAGDTFRAAAVEQLTIWADRLGVEIVKGGAGGDPAAVAHQAVAKALESQAEICIIDTAGRLQTQTNLMQQLEKIHRVIGKLIPAAPHETLLVLDATAGQNALSQAQGFSTAAKCTGIVLAKLDGTAKGGVIIPIRERFAIPVKFVGLGEKASDLAVFNADQFVEALFAGAA
jgi:fused signal recognition particle receptor